MSYELGEVALKLKFLVYLGFRFVGENGGWNMNLTK
jgi:hypothetical protein